MWFKSGGAIEFGQAMLRAGQLGMYYKNVVQKCRRYRIWSSHFTDRVAWLVVCGLTSHSAIFQLYNDGYRPGS